MNALLVGGIAILVALAWLFGFSYVYYGFYLAVGAPEAPTLTLKLAIPSISFLFGAIGAVGLVPLRSRVNRSGIILVCIVAVTVVGSAGLLAGADAALEQLKSEGFWGLLSGVLLSVYACGRLKAVTQQAHAGDTRNARA